MSPERRQYERRALARLEAAGATPSNLARARWLLTRGRKSPDDDYETTLNREAQEKAGLEFAERCLRGERPDTIIFRLKPLPEVTKHG